MLVFYHSKQCPASARINILSECFSKGAKKIKCKCKIPMLKENSSLSVPVFLPEISVSNPFYDKEYYQYLLQICQSPHYTNLNLLIE